VITPTTNDLLTVLRANPHQELNSVWIGDHKSWLILTTQNIVLHCDGNKWWWHYCDGFNPPTQDVVNPTQFTSLDTKDVHAEIDRVLNIAQQTHTPSSTMQETVSTEQTFVSTDRYRELEAELKMTASRDATQERVEALQQLLPLFCLGVNAPTDQVREKIEGLYSRHKELGLKANKLSDQLKTVTEERDCLQASHDYAQNLLNQVWGATGWLEHENEPCGIEYLKRLKSKADRAGLLSVVCRRLCGDENASIETVHAAIDRCHDESTTLDFIGGRLGVDPNGTEANHLGEIRSLVTQAVKSLDEKTVEVAKLQEGLTNYEAQLKGYAANKQLQMLTRITKILRDAEIATVYDYEENRAIETDERVRIICERLKQNTVERRDDGAKMHKLVDEIRQAHLTLNAMSAPRCMGTIDLSLSARIRSLFTQKV